MALTEVDNMNVTISKNKYTVIHMAIILGRVEILKYLVSKSNEPNKRLNGNTKTPLHTLAQFQCGRYTKCPCVEMLSIMIPKIKIFDVQDGLGNKTPLHMTLSEYRVRKQNECLI